MALLVEDTYKLVFTLTMKLSVLLPTIKSEMNWQLCQRILATDCEIF
jgi:hypothetical protein